MALRKPKRKPRERGKRLAQVKVAFAFTRERDPRLVPILLGVWGAVFVALFGIGLLLDRPVLFGFMAFFLASTVAMLIFTRRANRIAFAEVEGRPGAPLAILQSMRGNWRVMPAVAANQQQDMVHRVIGRPGLVLVGEGNPARVRGLLAQEKKRCSRVVGDTPIYDITVGDDKSAGQVPLKKLNRHITKLPPNVKPVQINDVERRLKSIGGLAAPIPKGPLPKNVRLPKGAKELPR